VNAHVPDHLLLTPERILADESASNWIKNALRVAVTRDPVDAANDAEILASVLRYRAEEGA
jgi:predicted nucleic acid-binding protein